MPQNNYNDLFDSMSPAAKSPLFAQFLSKASVALAQINRVIGMITSILLVFMVLAQSGIIVFRSAFSLGNLAAQDTVLYMHAALIMGCLAWTWQLEGHVRVDVFYYRFSALTRNWINCLGNLIFLLPFAAFITLSSWDYALDSWHNREASGDAGGLDRIYWLKTLIPLAGILLFIQGVSDTLNKLLRITYTEAEETQG